MSDYPDNEKQATPDAELESIIMSTTIPKSEPEWWARHEIERLRAELAEARRDAERLRDIFRANMLRYVPGVTHEQISAALDGERCFVNPKPIAAIDAARKESP